MFAYIYKLLWRGAASQSVKALCEQLLDYDNLYSIKIDSNDIPEGCESFIALINNKG